MLQKLDFKQYSALLDKLYQGPVEEAPFKTFLDDLRAVLALNFALIVLREPNGQVPGMLFMSGLEQPPTSDPRVPDIYSAYSALDPCNDSTPNTVAILSEIAPKEKLEKSDFYRLFLVPNDLHHAAAVALRDEDNHHYGLRLYRSQTGKPFSVDEREFIALLIPHITRALANGVKRTQLDAERRFYARAAFGRAVGSITLDEDGHILQTNEAAERLLAEKDGISRLHNHIHIKNAELNDTLRQQIQFALKSLHTEVASAPAIQAMSIPRPSGKADYELVIKTLPVDRFFCPNQSPHLIIFLSNPAGKVEISTRTLMTLYHLTQTEATLTILLAEGKTLDEVTQELNIARNTARAHLRAIFSKTGVTQQSMLVSLVLKSLASIAT